MKNILLAILFSLNGFLLINSRIQNKEIAQNEKKSLNNTIELESMIVNNLDNERHKIKNVDVIRNEIDTTTLKNLINEGDKLIFYFSELSCRTCVDAEIHELINLASKIGENKLIIAANYKNPVLYYRYKRLFKKDFVMLNLQGSKLGLPIEEKNKPFYFILKDSFEADCVFIPNKKKIDLTKAYLKIVENHFLGT